MTKVLVVEDEKQIAELIQSGLEEAGMRVELCHDGAQGLDRASKGGFDVVVLDIMLPGRDGLSVLRELRGQSNHVPVLLLTARGGPDDRVEGLELGADDYLVKPFYAKELVARIKALARRASGESADSLQVGDLVINLVTREVKRAGAPVEELTTREFKLLATLMRSPGQVVTRTEILEHVWGYDFDPGTNRVDVHIQRVRKKIRDGDLGRVIETIRGVGYRIAAP